MGKFFKLILLSLTVWPLLYTAVFVLSGYIDLFRSLNKLIWLPFLTATIGVSIIFFYFHELYQNHSINGQSKMKWFLLFLFTGQFGMIFYWKKNIW